MADSAARLRRIVPIAATGVALAALGAFLVHQRAHLAAHYALDPVAILSIALLLVATLFLRGLANQRIFARLGVTARARDWFGLVAVTAYTNYLPLSAGLVAKAYFLKRVHSLSYGRFAAAQVALLVIVVATNGVIGLAAMIGEGRTIGAPIIAGAFTAMIASGALLFLPERTARRLGGRFFAWETSTAPAARGSWPAVAVLQTGVLLAYAGSLKLAFGLGTAHASFAACLIFSAAAVVTRVVPITPGAIGIREFLIGGLAALTGVEVRDAVIAAAALRGVEILIVFGLGSSFAYGFAAKLASGYREPPSDAPSPPTA